MGHINPVDNLLWCDRHYKLQQKSYRCYKFASTLLDECDSLQRLTYASISACLTMEQLMEWDRNLRYEYIQYLRTIDKRRKHHDAYWEGGDEGHNNWIISLEERRDMLESLLEHVEDRAYALIIEEEDASWLSVLAPNDMQCGEDEHEHDDDAHNHGHDHACDDVGCKSTHDSEGIQTLTKKTKALAVTPRRPVKRADVEAAAHAYFAAKDYRSRLLRYYDYPNQFSDRPGEQEYATRIIDNIFRYVLSRHKRLLFHVRRTNATSVRGFLEDEAVQEVQLQQLWEGMKMRGWHGIGKEGKISIEVIKAAVEDADFPDDAPREGESVEILGGRVWSRRLKSELSDRGWDHFYQFVACADCAISLAQDFKTHQRIRRLAKPGYIYQGWLFTEYAGLEGTPYEPFPIWERQVLDRGGTLHQVMPSKGVTLETVRPRRKGLKPVFIERETRNWVFMRFSLDDATILRLTDTDREDLLVWSRHGNSTQVKTNREVPNDFWVKRLRTANSTLARKSARWSIDEDCCLPPCWIREFIKGGCPCRRHDKARRQTKQSIDVVVVDTAVKQDFEGLLKKIFAILGDDAVVDDSEFTQEKSNPFFTSMGRRFFHEVGEPRMDEPRKHGKQIDDDYLSDDYGA